MVEKNKDLYCPPAREADLTILVDKPWWDIIHSGPQTPSDLTEEWYSEFQNKYKIPIKQKVLIIQEYQQESQSLVESENDMNGESKWDSKMNDYDKEFREYY